MEIANVTLRLLAFSQILLFLCMILLSENPRRVRLVGVSLNLAILCYFVRPLLPQYLGLDWIILTELLPSLVPSLTLIFVWTIFEDNAPIPSWTWLLLGMDIVMSGWVLSLDGPDASLQLTSQLIKTFMALAAIYVVWKGRESDLNELRAKARIWFISSLVLTVLAVAIKEFFYIFALTRPSQIVGIAWMFILSLAGNLAFIKLNPQVLLVRQPVVQPPVADLEDPFVVELLERMRAERLYADHDLRVGSLADLVGVPEYQLRSKINKNLGYQNFNQFVNHYRIQEAGERLLSDPRTPVLSIALDVGFRSISSFNTAFQRKFGVSPTEYRSKSLSNN